MQRKLREETRINPFMIRSKSFIVLNAWNRLELLMLEKSALPLHAACRTSSSDARAVLA